VFLFTLATLTINAQKDNSVLGIWQLSSVEVNNETITGLKAIFIFSENGILNAARSSTSETMEVGTWVYDEAKNVIIMKSEIDKDFRGTASNVKVDKNTLSYKHNDAILNFTKTEMAKPNNNPIPTLSFTEEDFWENDEHKYPDEEVKLPWTQEGLYSFMKGKKEIFYTVEQYKKDFGKVDSWIISYKISFNQNDEINIREYSYFQNDYVDMTDNIFPLNNKTQKVFYPIETPENYRVIGEEQIIIELGELNCTIVEGIGAFQEKVKYWMINDQPGVYAKIIVITDRGNANYDSNLVYTLKQIK